jgi:hypothetical protein
MPTDEQTTQHTVEILRRFNHAFLHYEPDQIDDLVAEEYIIENTTPAPDGARHVGRKIRHQPRDLRT